jgi:thioredoxin 1
MSNLNAADDANFDQVVLQSKTPVLVDFWATWCRPCIMITPVLEELVEEYAGRLSIVKFDVDKNVKTAAKYGVMSIPNLIIFKEGKPAAQIVGYKSKAELKKSIDAALE